MGKLIDLVGQKFGNLTVTSRGPTDKNRNVTWWCACDCGKQREKTARGDHLKSGAIKSCGCLNIGSPVEDLIGQKFGKLTVISRGPSTKAGKVAWWCACDCGKQMEKPVQGSNLKSGHSTTCGCTKETVSVGQKFGKLTVISQGPNNKHGDFTWWCRCDCGKQKERAVPSKALNSGNSKSCGCESLAATQRSNDKRKAIAASTFIAKAQAVHGVGAYDYSKVRYLGSSDNVEIGCNTCGEYFPQMPSNHKDGKGCPSCAESGFNKNEPAIFYSARIDAVHPPVYMIGITNRTFEKRYSANDRSQMTLLETHEFKLGSEALALETKLKRNNKHLLYTGMMPIDKGNTEVFTANLLPSGGA